jgi:hypothetical protein
LIIKLNDLWFVYEGLYKICQEYKLLKVNATKYDPFTDAVLEDLGLDDIITNHNKFFKENIIEIPLRKLDCLQYFKYIHDNSTAKSIRLLIFKLMSELSDVERPSSSPSFNQIFAIIYGIRNMYVHATDTAKAGVKHFKTKILLLSNLNDMMTLVSMKIATFILNMEIEGIQ